jgi:hypothetical protein
MGYLGCCFDVVGDAGFLCGEVLGYRGGVVVTEAEEAGYEEFGLVSYCGWSYGSGGHVFGCFVCILYWCEEEGGVMVVKSGGEWGLRPGMLSRGTGREKCRGDGWHPGSQFWHDRNGFPIGGRAKCYMLDRWERQELSFGACQDNSDPWQQVGAVPRHRHLSSPEV